MPRRHVNLGDDGAEFVQTARRILDNDHVRTWLQDSAATLGKHSLGRVVEQLVHVLGPDIVQLETLGLQWFEVADLRL